MTVGHMATAVRRNSSSDAVSSWEASVTNSTASAEGSTLTVTALWVEASPPTPGVSTSTSPVASSWRGRPRRMAATWSASGAVVGSAA